MMTLAFDTSEAIGGVALLDDAGVADERMMEQPLQHAERLLPLIEEILEANGRTKEEVDRISVNVGPGSYTGLRIGVATAKGICQSLGIGLVGVDGTFAYRERVPDESRVCVVIPSRRDLHYVRWFTGRRARAAASVMREDELLEELRRDERAWVLVGSGAEPLTRELGSSSVHRLGPASARRPSPLMIARLGSREAGDQTYEVEPLYVESNLR
jgi:tRNA threonylcarbamoyladenosine biosynthesis protein TsaB